MPKYVIRIRAGPGERFVGPFRNAEAAIAEADKRQLKDVTYHPLERPIKPPGKREQMRRLWEGLDWTKQNAVLARQTGYSIAAVSYRRKQLGHALAPSSHAPTDAHRTRAEARNRETFWKGFDWSKSNVVLAEETGYTREYVRRMRERLGHAKTGKKPRFKDSIAERVLRSYHPDKTVRDIAEEAGTSVSYVSKILKKRDLTPKAIRPDYEGVDWSRRTKDIAAELGVGANVVSKWRRRLAPHTHRNARREG